jgi:hypothetical protein
VVLAEVTVKGNATPITGVGVVVVPIKTFVPLSNIKLSPAVLDAVNFNIRLVVPDPNTAGVLLTDKLPDMFRDPVIRELSSAIRPFLAINSFAIVYAFFHCPKGLYNLFNYKYVNILDGCRYFVFSRWILRP